MEQSEMEVETSETTPAKVDESCPQTKPSLPVESKEVEPSSPMESSSQIVPSSQAVPSGQTTPAQAQAIPSDQTPSDIVSNQVTSKTVPSGKSITSQAVSSDQATSSQVVPSDQANSSSDVPLDVASSSKVPSSVPGPSSEALLSSVASKITNGPASKKQRLDYDSMSTGVYLDSTVVPILHVALVTLDRLRPADPVQYVIDFLLRHKAQYSKPKEQTAPNASANQA